MLAEKYGDAVLPGGRLEAVLRRKYDQIGTLDELRGRFAGRRPSCAWAMAPRPKSLPFATWDGTAAFVSTIYGASGDFITEPDMVFTGARSTIEALDAQVIFGFASKHFAETTLKRYLFTSRRLSFIVAEQLNLLDSHYFTPFIPTNGAVMLTVATALAPRKLIVSGSISSATRGALILTIPRRPMIMECFTHVSWSSPSLSRRCRASMASWSSWGIY